MQQNIYKLWSDAFASVGLCSISFDTCCKLMAVVLVYGGSSEMFTHITRLKSDIETARRRLNIHGTSILPPETVKTIKQYVNELQNDVDQSPVGEDSAAPFSKVCHVNWAVELMKSYGMKKLIL